MRATDYLSPEEIQHLMRRSAVRGVFEIMHTWGWISAAFALVWFFPTWWAIPIALFILGGKQLACAIIMHDCSHHSLLPGKNANIIAGAVFGAWPILQDVVRYRPYHLQHHIHTGTDEDPDLGLTRGYPTSRASMMRKFARDLTGITGLKAHFGLLLMHLGLIEYNLGGRITRIKASQITIPYLLRNFLYRCAGPLLIQAAIFGALWLTGKPWLYLLWVGALMTTFQFCLRVRSIAEHSVVPDRLNEQQNTRTTKANFIERMLFAPHHVNYHAEHHLLFNIPPYRLPALHKILRQRGYYNRGLLSNGYLEVLRHTVK